MNRVHSRPNRPLHRWHAKCKPLREEVSLAPIGSMLELIAAQIARFEMRSGRRAAAVCIALPAQHDPSQIRRELESLLGAGRPKPPDLDFVQVEGGRPRIITVDFVLEDVSQ